MTFSLFEFCVKARYAIPDINLYASASIQENLSCQYTVI